LCSPPSGHTFEQLFFRKTIFYKEEYGTNPYLLIYNELAVMGCRLVDETMLGEEAPYAVLHFRQNADYLKKYPHALHIYIAMEPEVVCATNCSKDLVRQLKVYDYILSPYDDVVDNERIFSFQTPMDLSTHYPHFIEFDERGLLVSISANKYSSHPNELYSTRLDAIRYFEGQSDDDFDFYGRGWSDGYKNYKGAVDCKLECLGQYKYSLCFENVRNVRGGVSEKLFDCFFASCVPVYYGISNIRDYVPEDCFIDYEQFENIADCVAYLKRIPQERWMQYQIAIREYLHSPKAQAFSVHTYAQAVAAIMPLRAQFDGRQRSMAMFHALRLKRGIVGYNNRFRGRTRKNIL
jgi:hypothetical protein